MVETRLALEPEVQQIFEYIDTEDNFLLSGGAGSGKTYSLVSVIRQIFTEHPTAKVACMTYTNAAVKEIEDRVNHKNLNVTTIHDFLWDCIKHFQKELKITLIELINDPLVTRIKSSDDNPVPNDFFDNLEKGIQYKEFLKIEDGIISHDELLILANKIFENFPKISGIVKDKYQFIFVDEYQDTNTNVIDIFLNHFNKSEKKNIIGFFGDAMQSIYDDGIGNLDDYKGDDPGQIKEILKAQNRRNPLSVIKLANLLRTDGIQQVPSLDPKAPNMLDGIPKEGNAKFIYSSNPDFNRIKSYLNDNLGWHCNDGQITKELNLTHNLIADKALFRRLMNIYNSDQILAYKARVKKFIKENGVLEDFSNRTFRQAIAFLDTNYSANRNSFMPTAGMQDFINANPDLYNLAMDSNYILFSKMYVDKDQLLDDKKQGPEDENKKGSKRDYLIRHLFKIQKSINLYESKEYNQFLKVTDFKIFSIADKVRLKESIQSLIEVGEKSIEEIIDQAHDLGICLKDQTLERFVAEKAYIYDQVKVLPFSEFQNLYKYLEGHTPFSTQHKTKGTEFNTVLVILDNGGWNFYNFQNLFVGGGTPSVLSRTQKIFYVCCTRAKENLAVFYHEPSAGVIAKAKEWFGEGNIIQL